MNNVVKVTALLKSRLIAADLRDTKVNGFGDDQRTEFTTIKT